MAEDKKKLDLADDVEDEEEEDEKPAKGGLDDLKGDIFAEEDDRLKAFGDLEYLTMVEVMSEVEAVLEELRIRQGG